MRKCPHTSCRKGTTVRIVLRTGEVIIDKFIDRTGKFVILEKYGRIKPSEIKSFGIRKLKDNG